MSATEGQRSRALPGLPHFALLSVPVAELPRLSLGRAAGPGWDFSGQVGQVSLGGQGVITTLPVEARLRSSSMPSETCASGKTWLI